MAEPESKTEQMESTEEDDATSQAASTAVAVNQLLQNPQVLAAVQGRLAGMVGSPSGYIQSLPKSVKRRLKSLKKIQADTIEIEAKFYEEVHALEVKYAAEYAKFFEKRGTILSGAYEPTDEECEWASEEEDEDEEGDELATELQAKAKVEEVDETKEKQESEEAEKETDEEEVKGVPEFWLTIFKNVEMLADMIQDHDEPILKHLTDIKVVFINDSEKKGFTLEFTFSPNEYFEGTKLTKEYTMRCSPDPSDPFSYEGPEIIMCKGCNIKWKSGKNVTRKTIKKTQKHKGSGTKRTVSKEVQNDSFFNFFNPPTVPEGTEPDEDTETLLAADFEIGHFLRERVVPRAVLYFTGEALEDDDYEEEGEEDDGEEEADDDDDVDPDFDPDKDAQGGADCKQQ